MARGGYKRRSSKITIGWKTGEPARYDTGKGRSHVVETSTRGPGFIVATKNHGYVVPGTIQTYSTYDAAVAEIQRRARRDYEADHGVSPPEDYEVLPAGNS